MTAGVTALVGAVAWWTRNLTATIAAALVGVIVIDLFVR
jgi:hypothetical protein